MGPGAFLDLRGCAVLSAICFAFHVMIGVTALVGAVILVTLTIVTSSCRACRRARPWGLAARRNDLAATSRRNAEVLVAMGMSDADRRWSGGQRRNILRAISAPATRRRSRRDCQGHAHDAAVGGARRRAYLVIHQEATRGIIIAGSILSARAGAGRSRHRALERLRRRAPELASP